MDFLSKPNTLKIVPMELEKILNCKITIVKY